MTHWNC